MFQLTKGDEVARAELSGLRSEVARIASLLAAMSERIEAQAETIRAFEEQQARAERSQVEAADRIARLEDENTRLRDGYDRLAALATALDGRIADGERDKLKISANLARLERQAEIDLSEMRSDSQSLAKLLFGMRRELGQSGQRGKEDQGPSTLLR